jgi:hypothetical protein
LSDDFFDNDSNYGIHRELPKNKFRTPTSRNGRFESPSLFYDKLTIGSDSSTDILTLFAAKRVGRKVYVVEPHFTLA